MCIRDRFLLSLEDLAFWILATAGIFYMLYYENSGMFRWFSVIGAGVGMFLYKKTLRDVYKRQLYMYQCAL